MHTMHTGNLQPSSDVVGSVYKCTLEAFVLQQLEQKQTAMQFHQLHVICMFSRVKQKLKIHYRP